MLGRVGGVLKDMAYQHRLAVVVCLFSLPIACGCSKESSDLSF